MVAPGLFKLPRSTPTYQPRREPIGMAPIANGNVAAKGQGRHEKTRNQSLKIQPFKGTIAVLIKESAQEHQQPEKEQIKPKTPKQIQKPQQLEKTQSKRITNNSAGRSELAIAKRRNSAREVVPIVVVTEPEDTSREGVDSQVLSQGEPSRTPGDQSNDRLSREHDLRERPVPNVSDEVGSTIHQETQLLADCTPVEEILKRRVERIESHALSVCSPPIEPISAPSIAVQQHALADCTSSTTTLPIVQEISHAHDFANCQSTVLKYYEEGEEKVLPQNISNRARVRTASNAQVAEGVQEHSLEGCPTDGSASDARLTNENREHFPEFCPSGSSGSCDNAIREDTHDGSAARFAPNSLNGMDGVQEHPIEEVVDIFPGNSTLTSVLNNSQSLVPAGLPIINSSTAIIRSDVQRKSRAIEYANANENLSAADSQRMEMGEIQRGKKAVHAVSPFTCSIVNLPVPTGFLHDLPPNPPNGMDGVHEHPGEKLLDNSPRNSTPASVPNTSQQLISAGRPFISSSTAMIRFDDQQKSRAIKCANTKENPSAADGQGMEIREIRGAKRAVHDLSPFTCSIVNLPVPTGCLHDLPSSKELSRISRCSTVVERTKVGGGVSSTLRRSMSYGGFTARESWPWIMAVAVILEMSVLGRSRIFLTRSIQIAVKSRKKLVRMRPRLRMVKILELLDTILKNFQGVLRTIDRKRGKGGGRDVRSKQKDRFEDVYSSRLFILPGF